jgi:prepilin-type N-terminal cleavage/methylation domain-containing protein
MRTIRPMTWPGPSCRRHRPREGFTLAEVIVVMALMAIATAMALPHLDRARLDVDSQAQSIRGVLIMAQRQAVTRGHDVVVTFDTAARLVRVQEDPNGNMVADPGERLSATAVEGEVAFSRGSAPVLRSGQGAGVNFTARVSGMPAFVFHRDGSASERAVFYLTSRRSGAGGHATDSRAFDLERATGRVIAYRYDGTAWQREF